MKLGSRMRWTDLALILLLVCAATTGPPRQLDPQGPERPGHLHPRIELLPGDRGLPHGFERRQHCASRVQCGGYRQSLP